MLRALMRKLAYPAHFQHKQSDYYRTLGLERNSSSTEIKKKYYELAKIYHPDVNQSEDAQVKFMQISKAYQILSDATKRKEYDADNTHNPSQTKEGDPGFHNKYRSKKQHWRHRQDFDPFTSYDEFFKKNRGFAKPKRGDDISMNVTITLEESIQGIDKTVKYVQKQICRSCQGQEMPLCMTCGGKKQIYNRIKRQKQACSKCNGRGYKNDCGLCEGHMFVVKEVEEKIHISRNTHSKSILRLEGLGNHGYRHKNGDLYITVFVEESKHFRIDGNNVHSEHRLDFITATCGGQTSIHTVFGNEEVEIEAGVQSGQEIRLYNKGLMSPYSKRRGDHIIVLRIKIPNNLSEKQKNLLSKLQTDF